MLSKFFTLSHCSRCPNEDHFTLDLHKYGDKDLDKLLLLPTLLTCEKKMDRLHVADKLKFQ